MMDRVLTLMPLLVLVNLTAISPAPADDVLSRYYAGLRQRGLYRLAESDCLRRLAEQRATTGQRAELSIELSRTYAAHAARRTGEESEELWERAAEIVEQAMLSGEAEPYSELLASQRAFVEASRGALLRWQVEVFPLDDRGRKRAAEVLRSALERFEPLPAALGERMRLVLDQPAGHRSVRDRPAVSRYRQTRREVEFRSAAATVDLAKVLPTGPDQAEALHRAETALREVIKTPKPDESAWRAEVLRIEVLRLRGDLDRVGPRVATLLGKEPPEMIRDAAVAQWVKADLDAGRPDEAVERLQTHRKEHGTASDELAHLLVETLLAARRLAFDKQQPELANDLLSQAASFAAELSGAWGDRARVLIETAREAETYGPKLADSVRRAKWAWRSGNLDGAIAAFHEAVKEAHRSRQADVAVELAITLATLQTEAGRYKGAETTLTGLLENYPDSPRAADGHLQRAYALAKQYEQNPGEKRLQEYRTSLEEHRKRYAESPTAIKATWMLARLEEFGRNWRKAIALLESIPAGSEQSAEAQARLAVVYEQLLADLRQRGEPTDEWERQAISALQASADRFPPIPEALSEPQQEIAWRLAGLMLRQPEPDFSAADSLLERVLHHGQTPAAERGHSEAPSPAPDPTRRSTASQLRIISLAGQGRLAEAQEIIQRLEASDPDRLLDVLNGLTDVAEQVSLEHLRTVGTLQLELSQRLDERRETLSGDQARKLDESLAQGYAALGQIQKAAAVYEKLIWQDPKDVRTIESLARVYMSCETTSCLRHASKQWQALERMQRKGTVEWLESRYHIAWCQHRMGKDESARKMIGITRVLYPDLGHPVLKEKYEKLAAKLKTNGHQK